MIVLRLINGENIICRIDVDVNSLEDLDACNYITVYDPMSIDRDEEGMKLRDCLMLSQDDKLIIRANDIITLYTPAERLVEYYTKALVYSKGFTKPMVNEQMKYAIDDLDEAMSERENESNRLVRLLMKASGGSGTIQ